MLRSLARRASHHRGRILFIFAVPLSRHGPSVKQQNRQPSPYCTLPSRGLESSNTGVLFLDGCPCGPLLERPKRAVGLAVFFCTAGGFLALRAHLLVAAGCFGLATCIGRLGLKFRCLVGLVLLLGIGLAGSVHGFELAGMWFE